MKAVKNQPRVARSGGVVAPQPHPAGRTGGTTAPRGNPYTTGLNGAHNAAANYYSPKTTHRKAPNTPGPPGVSGGGPEPTATPWDAAYEQSAAAARAKYNNANISLDYLQKGTEQDYGLSPGFNDYQSNPYSRAALLESSYQKANRGSTNSYAASGQLYAGSLSNQLGTNRNNYAQGHDALEKAYRDAIQEIQSKRTAAKDEENETINNAKWKQIENAMGEKPEAATAPEKNKPKPKNHGKKKGKK